MTTQPVIERQLYCQAPECDDPKNPGFPRPVFRFDLCQSHAKQLQRRGWTGPIRPHRAAVTPEMRALEASIALVEADSDADFAAARRRWMAACVALAHALAPARADERGLPAGGAPPPTGMPAGGESGAGQ